MLMDEAPSNAGWTSTWVLLQMEALEMFLAMYGSTDRCSSAPHLEHACREEIDALTNMERLRRRTGGSGHHPAPSQLHIHLATDPPSSRHGVRRYVC